MDTLKEDGYIIFRNIISPHKLQEATQYIKDNTVNYYMFKNFIDYQMLDNVGKKLKFKLKCTKYRISNNNNSSDAGQYHRDIRRYDSDEMPNLFTCLTYLDTAYMQLIPKSHKFIQFEYHKIPSYYKKGTIIKMNPGDILVFYSTMIHRGVFYLSRDEKYRRLVQLFDCVNIIDFKKYNNSILHVPCRLTCNNSISKFLIYINKIKLISMLFNLLSFMAPTRGYGFSYYNLNFMTNDKHIKYVSTEANAGRIQVNNVNKFLPDNKYIINTNFVKDIDEKYRKNYIKLSSIDTLNFIVTSIIITIIIIIIYTKKMT